MKRYILILIVFIATFALGYASYAAQFGAVENTYTIGYSVTITYANNTVNVASTAANNQTSTTYYPTTVTQTYTKTVTYTVTGPGGTTVVTKTVPVAQTSASLSESSDLKVKAGLALAGLGILLAGLFLARR